MLHNRKPLLIALVLSVQTTVTLAPAFAQESPGYTPDLINVDDIYTPTPANEVPTAQIPSGLFGVVFDVLGPKQKPGQARTINETQRKLLKVYDYGQKALNAYKLGRSIYDAVDNFSLKDTLGGSIASILQDYDKIGKPNASEQGGSGSDSPIYPDPKTPYEVYTQARNDESRRALLPQLMTKLVFSEDGQALIKQQSEQVQQSVVNTIEATQALVQISANSQEQAAAGGEIAVAVGKSGQQAQTKKSAQSVLKSLAAQNSQMAQGTATNGAILSNVVAGQEQQKRSTDALVVGSALAHQQRTTGLHLSASELTLQEQIRAELEQYKDERHRAADQKALQEQLSFNYFYVPGLHQKATP